MKIFNKFCSTYTIYTRVSFFIILSKVGSLSEIEEIIIETVINGKLVVIDFAANNCPPCEMVAPIYLDLSESEEFTEKGVQFLKVNVNDSPDIAIKFNVDGWPTILFFQEGKEQDRIVGGNAVKLRLYDMVTKYAFS